MSQDYRYVCEDRSVLLPYYKKLIWQRLLPMVPEQVSPNSLSILGNAFSLAAFAALLVLTPSQHYLFLFPAVATFMYLTLDNMDGMHARRTGQSSPLGEFLDHWFDAFNSGYLVFGLYYAARQPDLNVLVILAATNLAYFATMWEQRHTGVIRFGRGGQVEGVTVIVLFYLGITLFGHEALSSYQLFGLFSVADLTAILLMLGYVMQVGGAVARTRKAFSEWLPLLWVSCGAVAWYHVGRVGFFPMAFLLLLIGALFGGRHIMARVLRKPYTAVDPVLMAGIAALSVASLAFDLGPRMQAWLGWALAAYVLGRLAYDFLLTIDALRHHMRPGELLERALVWRKRS